MSRFLDFLTRVFQLVPPPPRLASVLLNGPRVTFTGLLIRRWPRIIVIGEDGCRFEIEPRHVCAIGFAPEGYVPERENQP